MVSPSPAVRQDNPEATSSCFAVLLVEEVFHTKMSLSKESTLHRDLCRIREQQGLAAEEDNSGSRAGLASQGLVPQDTSGTSSQPWGQQPRSTKSPDHSW